MPKMEAASMTIKISLDQIIETGNIREKEKYGPNDKGKYPQEIIELAMSIKEVGQLQPIIVKYREEKEEKKYELIAGHRRLAAHKYLVSLGDDYNQIDAKIITGNKLAIQLIENMQREDLTSQEREAAVYQLHQNGMKQKEIAAQLSKNPGFVSVNIAAYKMRQTASNEGIDLNGVETSTLAEFLSVPDTELPDLLKQLVNIGGTRTAASQLAAKYKKVKASPPPETTAKPAQNPVKTAPPPKENNIHLLEESNMPAEPLVEKQLVKPDLIKLPPHANDSSETKHLKVELNIVLTVIYDYIKELEKRIYDAIKTPSCHTDLTVTINDSCKVDAAKDILALIHNRLNDA